eukprot:SAG11_NODE_588_length_8329_cov_18.642857_13_plen_73_part_00
MDVASFRLACACKSMRACQRQRFGATYMNAMNGHSAFLTGVMPVTRSSLMCNSLIELCMPLRYLLCGWEPQT